MPLDLVERDTGEIVRRFSRYLSKDRVTSGEALADAQKDYRASASKREAEITMPKAWSMLLDEPDGLLIELLRERTEALCGHKPTDSALENFLRQQVKSGDRDVEISQRTRRVTTSTLTLPTSAEHNEPTVALAREAGRNTWKIADRGKTERNGTDALAGFLTAPFELYPDKHEAMAAAVRTRGRNNIARNPAELYPHRPEIGLRSNRRLPGGWFVGTNESSATKRRIVVHAAGAVNLVINRDYQFDVHLES